MLQEQISCRLHQCLRTRAVSLDPKVLCHCFKCLEAGKNFRVSSSQSQMFFKYYKMSNCPKSHFPHLQVANRPDYMQILMQNIEIQRWGDFQKLQYKEKNKQMNRNLGSIVQIVN